MEAITHKTISDKIKQIPDYLSDELSDFVDYLLFKKEKDWAENLSEEEKNSNEQGLDDINNGRIHSHESVMDEISEYIKSRKK
ncbi:hypothetical protein [Chryseobacterium foetidum]|uniref:hypothetical protein n=1 Tax=Chryseobacterium foetidum TaxID=2951057 RepID=UPI0021CA0E17|nr:hypothetical protein [Chryseobacterium foetidum]